jgi:hypothetical protein
MPNICSEVVWTDDLGLVDGELLPNRNITSNALGQLDFKTVVRGLSSGLKIYWLATNVAHF